MRDTISVAASITAAKANGLAYIETSALTDNNISLVFETVCRKVLRSGRAPKEQASPSRIVSHGEQPQKKKGCC